MAALRRPVRKQGGKEVRYLAIDSDGCVHANIVMPGTIPSSVHRSHGSAFARSNLDLFKVFAAEDVMERVMGIEPTLVAWEATVLPLNYTRAPGLARIAEGRSASQPGKNDLVETFD